MMDDLVKLEKLQARMDELFLTAHWVLLTEGCDERTKLNFYQYILSRANEIGQETVFLTTKSNQKEKNE